MIGELDVQAHPDELPAFLRKVVQVLVQHSRVEPAAQTGQVPDVDRVLDFPHTSSTAGAYRWFLLHRLRQDRPDRLALADRDVDLCRQLGRRVQWL